MSAFRFPDRVNEVSARLVAGGVVLMCLAVILLDVPSLALVIAYGFVARALAGPTFSPLAVAAALEALFALCLGCLVFTQLMRLGVIPESVCAECGDLRHARRTR